MLVNATEMLKKAKAGHYAVGQFNINNLEWTKAILLTAQELNSPVILGVSEGAGKYMTGYKTVVGMVNGMMEELNITVPVALHLDHGSYEGCLKCVEAGFSSIMFDGSHYPIEENVAKTKELVKIVAEHGMSLEAEVGSIGGEEDGVVGMGECADPQECKMIADLGIDFLAAGIGNIHGKYPANWKGLSFETLDAIQQLTNYAVNSGADKRIRVHVDAENYRAKREQSLESLARKVAAKVTRYRRSVTLEPMNAYERHVIHAALQDVPGVNTYSIGSEPNRRVVVSYDRDKR